ncbi:DUF11 domain-containing protein (plasmid) [Synechocystis sp. B12]|nr:DUF11 domain-containing protein [Synechocystis sp. B12]
MKSIRFLVPALLSLAALDATAQSCTSLVVNGQSVSYGGFEVRVTNIGAPCDAGFATKVMPEGEQPLGSGNVIAQVWPFNQPDPIDGSTWSLSSVASLTPPSGNAVPLNTYEGRYIGSSWVLGTDEAYTVRFSALPNAFIGDGPQCFLFTAGNLQSFVGEPFAVNLSEEAPANRPNNTAVLCVAPGGGNSGPDLSITKTDDVDPVSAGGLVTYTLTVINEGDAIAELSRITDVLPAGWTFVSATASIGACSHASGTINCGVGGIIAGGTRTVTIVAQAPTTAGVYVNNASVVTASAESNTENNTTQETTTVIGGVDLSFGKTGPATVAAGAPISWTITGNNAGPSVATNVTVTDNVPAGVTGITASGTGWSCSIAAQTVTCTRPSLAVGAAPAITISGTAPTTAQTLVNTCAATSAEPDPTPGGSCEATTIVQPVVDLSIVKSDSADPVVAGAALSYQLDVANAGPSAASTVTVSDTLPSGYTATAASGTGWSCSIAGQNISCTRPSLAVGSAPAITITGTAPTTAGTILNTASVSSPETDSNPGNNTDSETTGITASSDLSFGKTGPATVAAGAPISWTITGNNAGPSVATNVTVTDNVPAGVTGITASGTGWSCSIAAQTVTCTRPSLAVGAAPAITISGTAPTTAQTLVNTCAATSAEPDPTPGGSCEATTIVQPVVDLSIVKSDSADPVVAGAALSYQLDVANAGPSAASTVTVSDTLPSGYTATAASGTGWSCSIAGQNISCTRPSLAVGSAPAITITGTAPTTAGTILNTASVSSPETDSNPGNNTDSETTTIAAAAGLAVAKTDSVDPVVGGAALEYRIDVLNSGPTPATDLVVTDTLPPGYTATAASGTGWSCSTAAQTVTCTRPSLAVGAAPAITISGSAPEAPGSSATS